MNVFKIFIVVLFLFACNKTTTPTPSATSTSLKITVTDSNGVLIQGVSVKLYLKEADLSDEINQIGKTAITDQSGSVVFDSLQAVKYFFFADNGCVNNQL